MSSAVSVGMNLYNVWLRLRLATETASTIADLRTAADLFGDYVLALTQLSPEQAAEGADAIGWHLKTANVAFAQLVMAMMRVQTTLFFKEACNA
jgi:hypothetical protein